MYMKTDGVAERIMMVIIVVTIIIRQTYDQPAQKKPDICKGVP